MGKNRKTSYEVNLNPASPRPLKEVKNAAGNFSAPHKSNAFRRQDSLPEPVPEEDDGMLNIPELRGVDKERSKTILTHAKYFPPKWTNKGSAKKIYR